MRRLFGWALLTFLLLLPDRVAACSIPVFRYALERWNPAKFEVVVFHKAPLGPPEQALLADLAAPSSTNVTVNRVDLSGEVDPEMEKLWQAQGDKTSLPWVVVRFPEDEDKAPLWAGRLQADQLASVLDSPSRRQVARLLGEGQSAVFVVLESDDQADRAAHDLLQQVLARMTPKIALPEQTAEGPQLRSNLPLKVSFEVVRLRRQAVGEESFIRQLLQSEEGLEQAQGPIVFPIFGRGRLLAGLHGKDLNARELEGVCTFLCGACSCQVKELNPGVDLLMACDWDKLLDVTPLSEPPPAVPTTSKLTIPPGERPAAKVEGPPSEAHPAAPAPGRSWAWLTLPLGILIIGSGTWALRSRRPEQ